MMNFVKLYNKEFMKERKSFVVTLVLLFLAEAFLYSRIGHWPTGIPTFISGMIAFGVGIGAFFNSFDYMGDEWKRSNHYLMLSLPVRGWDIFGAKLAWLMTEFGTHLLLLGAYSAVILLGEARAAEVLTAQLYQGVMAMTWRVYGIMIIPMLYTLASMGILALFAYTVSRTVKQLSFLAKAVGYIVPLWLFSYLAQKVMAVSPSWMHIEMPLVDALALDQLKRGLESSGIVNVDLWGLENAVLGIDMASVVIWAAGMVAIFIFGSWLLENRVEA
ncbi:hypothetical protein [Mahella sp.]|uniref:hypothetical protein n=1 Tax=Mahella sp. TaxID=2798721 RepID=UPI0025BA5FF7|nr:hypothetical protein [Mahella sp.]MBZ4665786.1 hypothetical protein [Mahella sp.]